MVVGPRRGGAPSSDGSRRPRTTDGYAPVEVTEPRPTGAAPSRMDNAVRHAAPAYDLGGGPGRCSARRRRRRTGSGGGGRADLAVHPARRRAPRHRGAGPDSPSPVASRPPRGSLVLGDRGPSVLGLCLRLPRRPIGGDRVSSAWAAVVRPVPTKRSSFVAQRAESLIVDVPIRSPTTSGPSSSPVRRRRAITSSTTPTCGDQHRRVREFDRRDHRAAPRRAYRLAGIGGEAKQAWSRSTGSTRRRPA